VNFGGLQGRWTPEELLLAAIASCFTTTFRVVASNAQSDFTDLEVEASAVMRKLPSGYSLTEITIQPTLKIGESVDQDQALDLLKRAERLCLISRAIDTPLRFEPRLEVLQTVESV
jgi:organic hydroperoxide reductase OsmC/OhrA